MDCKRGTRRSSHNKASPPLHREQVDGCIRAATAAIIIGQRGATISKPTTTMRTRKRTLRPRRGRRCCRRTLRPRRGRRCRRCTKTIKKLIPRSAGLLLLILFSVKLERERKISSLDFELVAILPRTRRQSDLFFTAASSVGSYKSVREDHLPKEDLRNLPRPRDSACARRPDRPRSEAI